MFRLAVFLILCSRAAVPANSLELRQKDVTLVLSAESLTPERKLRLADRLQLRILVEGGAKLEVALDPLKADERVWSIQEHGTDLAFRPWEKWYTLDPLQPGSLPLPVIALRYRDGLDREWNSVRWADVILEVLPPAKGGIRLNTPLEDPPEQPSSLQFFPWWSIPTSVVAVMLLGLAGWWLRQPRRVNEPPPDERAMRELERMSQPGAFPPDQPGWFHARVSRILRGYIQERFDIPALRQTTEEVLRAVRRSATVSEELQRDIETLLHGCDRVKFAGAVTGEEQKVDMLTLARRIVEQTVKPAA